MIAVFIDGPWFGEIRALEKSVHELHLKVAPSFPSPIFESQLPVYDSFNDAELRYYLVVVGKKGQVGIYSTQDDELAVLDVLGIEKFAKE